MKKYDELIFGREEEFFFLMDVIINEPQKVAAIVSANRDLLRVTNYSGENLLHWFAVENMCKEISLLRTLGSPIPTFALIHALEMGHLEAVILMLELGAEVEVSICKRALECNSFKIPARKIRILKSYFKQFGYML